LGLALAGLGQRQNLRRIPRLFRHLFPRVMHQSFVKGFMELSNICATGIEKSRRDVKASSASWPGPRKAGHTLEQGARVKYDTLIPLHAPFYFCVRLG
jgi:hypothetical protein